MGTASAAPPLVSARARCATNATPSARTTPDFQADRLRRIVSRACHAPETAHRHMIRRMRDNADIGENMRGLPGPLAQRQSSGLLIHWFRVRIPGGPPSAVLEIRQGSLLTPDAATRTLAILATCRSNTSGYGIQRRTPTPPCPPGSRHPRSHWDPRPNLPRLMD